MANSAFTEPDTSTFVAKSLYDANTILKADSDNTPAALTLGANTFPARSSSGNILAKTITDFGLSLVDDADAATARATLGALQGAKGTSFPGSPATDDLYYRTDLDLLCFYDGTRWLTVTLYEVPFGAGAGSIPFTATAGLGYLPTNSTYDLWLVDWSMTTLVLTTNDGSNNWTIKLQKTNAANTATDIDSFSTGTTPDTPTNWVLRQRSLGVLLGGSSTWKQLDLLGTKVGTGGNLYFGSILRYRLVVT